MSEHPVLVKGALGAILGTSVDMVLILGFHVHGLLLVVCLAVAVGILSGLAVNAGMPGVH